MREPDWRRPADYKALSALDTPDLAAEFLRRNPDYEADHDRLARLQTLGRLTEAELTAFATRWGSRFHGRGAPDPLDPRRAAFSRPPCRCPIGRGVRAILAALGRPG